jgi:hypothetical protein
VDRRKGLVCAQSVNGSPVHEQLNRVTNGPCQAQVPSPAVFHKTVLMLHIERVTVLWKRFFLAMSQ